VGPSLEGVAGLRGEASYLLEDPKNGERFLAQLLVSRSMLRGIPIDEAFGPSLTAPVDTALSLLIDSQGLRRDLDSATFSCYRHADSGLGAGVYLMGDTGSSGFRLLGGGIKGGMDIELAFGICLSIVRQRECLTGISHLLWEEPIALAARSFD